MNKRLLAARILAVLGAVLVWLPVLAPAFFGLVRLARAGRFSFDYLMPAELFPAALAGCLLLGGAALLGRLYRRPILIGLVTALAALGAGMLVAQFSGLASGAIEPHGIWWVLVVGSLVVYILALVAVGAGGIFLLRRLFGRPQSASA